jgi:hypothetical protein
MSRPQLIYARLLPSFFCLLVWSGCSLHQPPQERHVSDLGYFQFRAPTEAMKGVIIGAPHGSAEPASDEYAKWISDQTGAGFIVAYGFGVKRLAVTRPLIGSIANSRIPNDPRSRGNIYREFRRMLRQTAGGNLVSLYVGVRSAARESELNQIEIASSGFTFDELNHLKRSFLRIRDRLVMDSEIPKISVAIDPLDKISWPVYAMKHHGVLMSAQRGLNLRLPQILSATPAKLIYRRVLSVWISEALDLIHKNRRELPRMTVKLLDYGRIESIPARTGQADIVIAAPHGSFDEHTAEMVERVSYRAGLAAVIAKGFTPTECGGWRINVNRPTESRYPSGEIEIDSERAQKTYHSFKEATKSITKRSKFVYRRSSKRPAKCD